MNMDTTMVQLKKKTTERLKTLKEYERQSYDEIINRLIQETEEGPLSDEEIKEIKEGLDDVKAGRVNSIEEVAKHFGVNLK
jgi:predicted transcriptional regulator|tara:strand:- start:412 stop:654 length:243 start_codon:yes stop_codon:yes gene_type:complete